MSRLHSIRRLALFTGSSLAAGGVAAAISLGAVVLPPSAAHAQVTCAPPPSSSSGSSVTYSGSYSAGITCAATGNATINIAAATGVTPASSAGFGLDLTVASGTTALAVARYAGPGPIPGGGGSFTGNGRLTGLRAAGAGEFTGDVGGWLHGNVDFTGLGGPSELNILGSGAWWLDSAPVAFGSGDTTLTTGFGGEALGYLEDSPNPLGAGPMKSVGGLVYAGSTFNDAAVEPDHVIEFGAGEDVFDNAGYLFVGGLPASANNNYNGGGTPRPVKTYEATVRLEGLETFVNRGVIMLGGLVGYEMDGPSQNYMGAQLHRALGITDLWHDDILSMPGTTLAGGRVVDANGHTAVRWNGDLAVGEIFTDIDLAAVQTACTRDSATGDLAAADCLILDGGSTDASENPIYFRLVEPIPGDRGAINTGGIVLVDMGATGTSQQGDVAISPNQDGYDPRFGGFMDKGAFAYIIAFDESDNQHKLFSAPSGNTMQFPLMAQAAHGLWRASSGTWFDRQADIRGDLEDNVGGVWGRIIGEQASRDVVHSVSGFGQTFDFDNSYEQSTYAVTGGVDLLFGNDGDTAYVAGLTLGYAHSDMEFDASPNVGRFDGWTGGAYASFVSGGLFVDGSITANNILMDFDSPAMDLFPDGTILSTRAISLGGQVEAGWRVPMFMEGGFVEPLVGVSYVRSTYDDLDIPADDPARQGVTVEFDDPTSLRASIGVRAGMEQDFGPVRAQVSGLLRLWNEMGDETAISLINPGPTAVVTDEFSGNITEVGVGANVYSAGGLVSGFLNLGGKFGDDYQAISASTGVRVNW